MLCIEEGASRGAECEVSDGGHIVVGRSGQCDLMLHDNQVSRMHFRLDAVGGELRVTDLESQNGTWVNEDRIAGTIVVRLNDTLKAGNTVLRIRESSRGFLTGTVLAGYRLQRRIGSGGMGDVYRAKQVSLGRTVAVKILSDKLTKDHGFVERFIAEARAAGKLSHPNVVQVYDVGEDSGRYFISMEYVDGGSVEDLLETDGKLDPARALEIAVQTSLALEYAEKVGIVHCDVKPDNLLLTSEGDVRLSDLGVAKQVGDPAAGDDEGVFGSPHYMSPEQARGDALDHRSDLYSLGATLYRLLSGRTLFAGERSRQLMEKQVFEKPVPLRRVNAAVPAALADITMKLVEKDPDDRYQSASDLMDDLDRARGAARRAAKQKPPKLPTGVTVRQVRPKARQAPFTGVLVKIGAAVILLTVFGFLLASHLGQGREAFDRARRLEAEGDREAAAQAYEEVMRLEAPSSALALRARTRLEAIEDELDRSEERRRCLEAVGTANAEAEEGGLALARAIEKVAAVCRSSTVGLDVGAGPLAKLQERLESAAKAELESIRERAGKLVAEKRYGAAAQLFAKFPNYYRGTEAAQDIDAEAPAIVAKAHAEWEAARSEVGRLADGIGPQTGALEEAREILFPFIHRTGIAKIADEAKELRDGLETTAREVSRAARDRRREERSAQAEAVAAQARLAEHGYHFAEARKLSRRAEDLFRRQGEDLLAEELDLRIQTITRAEILFEMLLKRADEMALTRHTVAVPGGPSGRVVGSRRAEEEFVLRGASGDETRVKWDCLPPAQIIALFRAMKLAPDDRLVVAEFALDHGLVLDARKEFLYANRVRADKALLAQALKDRAEAGDLVAPDEDDARTLADMAMAGASAGDVEAAAEALDRLKTRYAATDTARTRAAEIAEAIAVASADPAP